MLDIRQPLTNVSFQKIELLTVKLLKKVFKGFLSNPFIAPDDKLIQVVLLAVRHLAQLKQKRNAAKRKEGEA